MTKDTSKADTTPLDQPQLEGSSASSVDAVTDGTSTPRIGKAAILFAIALGVFAGLGVFTFGYGKGASYLSNNPQTCVNCHVMQDHMDSWQQSSHHHVAVCNDCHLPHDAIGKWVTKADNGFFHSLVFTLGGYKNPIQIKPRNRRVTQSTCVDCHQDFVHNLLPASTDGDMQSCVHCHADVGHAGR
ncbi:MAG: cytochrome c nitrite reductase small subunit [Rubripirellula sp.]|nr:cytochrome c nitrite reductase small subunit [Rubripirellula sp.]